MVSCAEYFHWLKHNNQIFDHAICHHWCVMIFLVLAFEEKMGITAYIINARMRSFIHIIPCGSHIKFKLRFNRYFKDEWVCYAWSWNSWYGVANLPLKSKTRTTWSGDHIWKVVQGLWLVRRILPHGCPILQRVGWETDCCQSGEVYCLSLVRYPLPRPGNRG